MESVGVWPTVDLLAAEPVAFGHPGCQIGIQVNRACCNHGSKGMTQSYLLPDLKSSMMRGKIKNEVIMERHLTDGDSFKSPLAGKCCASAKVGSS